MDKQIEREILEAHADRLNAGLRGLAAYPPMTSDQQRSLEPLLQLAERLYEALVPVELSPAFVQSLGQELALAMARNQLSLVERYRKVILVAAATLGSALSLVGLVLFYLFRQRDTTPSTPVT
jgi:hypothetical protein